MSSHKNRVKMTVSGTPGTGTITLSAASSGYQSLATAYGANATVDVLITEGTAWEVARDCAYTHSGTTLSRGTLEESSTGSAVSFTSAAVVSVVATADSGRTWDSAALNTKATGTDANTTMAVGTMYVVDMSAWATADRTYTLPATAAVGDRVGVTVTAGDATHELILTAGSGGTLNGIAGGTEWSRLFITNEVVVMRCIVANATWVVEQDGRLPCIAGLLKTTNTTVSTGTGSPTKISVNSTILDSAGGVADPTTNNRLDIRRGGRYQIAAKATAAGSSITGHQSRVHKNATFLFNLAADIGGSKSAPTALGFFTLAAGDYLELFYVHTTGSNRDYYGASGDDSTSIYLTELV